MESSDEDDEVESEDEDIVLNEIGDEEESKAEEVTFTRYGRTNGNKKRLESNNVLLKCKKSEETVFIHI